MKLICITTANAIAFVQHKNELEIILDCHKIDIMLISATYFTDKNHFNINVYNTSHSIPQWSGKSDINIKSNIKHYKLH